MRKRRCENCKYSDDTYCAKEPEWLYIGNARSHYCSHHEWTKEIQYELNHETMMFILEG